MFTDTLSLMGSRAFIETRSGRRFTPLTPHVADIQIGDIAHALAHQCRFSGHTRVHYSVAEHCVRVSELLEQWGQPKVVQLWGLLHDASEAYLVDIPLPLKLHPDFAPYREAETRLMRAICNRFNLSAAEPAVVKRADEVLLATEARDLMPFRPEHWGKLAQAPLPTPITPWCAIDAREEFLERFVKLTAEEGGGQ